MFFYIIFNSNNNRNNNNDNNSVFISHLKQHEVLKQNKIHGFGVMHQNS